MILFPLIFASIQPRIRSGDVVPITSATFNARVYNAYLNQGFCGAVFIDQTTLLTAAHCVDTSSATLIGAHQETSEAMDLENECSQLIGISSIFIHPQYDPNTYAYDIALIHISRPPICTVDAIQLDTSELWPYEATTQEFTVGIVYGYGSTDGSNDQSRHLQSASYDITRPQICFAETLTHQCAQSPNASVCYGDSGGPLVVYTPSPVLVGITSLAADYVFDGQVLKCMKNAEAYFVPIHAVLPFIISFINQTQSDYRARRDWSVFVTISIIVMAILIVAFLQHAIVTQHSRQKRYQTRPHATQRPSHVISV